MKTLPSLYSASIFFFASPLHFVSLEEVRKNVIKVEKKLVLAIVRTNPTNIPAIKIHMHSNE